LARWRCSDSTFYEDVNRLVAHRKLQRIPTGHGDDLAVWGTLPVADPAFVRERARCVLDTHLEDELRTACAADLFRLSERSDMLPDDMLLKLFQSAVQDAKLPGRAPTIDALRNVANRTAAHVSSTGRAQGSDAEDLDWPELLAKLRRRVGKTLLDQIRQDIEIASWACDILLALWTASTKTKLVGYLLEQALTKTHSMPSFERALPGLVRALSEAIASNGDASLKARVRLRIDQALNNPSEEGIRDQARMLQNELRQALLP